MVDTDLLRKEAKAGFRSFGLVVFLQTIMAADELDKLRTRGSSPMSRKELCQQDIVDVTTALRTWEKKLHEAGLLADSARMEDLREQFERCDVAYLETGDRPF